MALPLTGISFTMIRDAIGAGVTDLAGLRSSGLVNKWGLKPPGEDGYFNAQHLYTPVSNSIWGKVDTAPYEAGDFRGYDHYNRCFALDSIAIEGDQASYNTSKSIRLGSKFFPSNSNVDASGVWAKYQVWFSRVGNFEQTKYDAGVLTLSINTSTNVGTGSITINNYAPPDDGVNGDLQPNSTVYLWVEKLIEVSHNFKWDDAMNSVLPYSSNTPAGFNLGKGWVIPFSTGLEAVANVVVDNFGTYSGGLSRYVSGQLQGFRCSISNDGAVGASVDIRIEYRTSNNSEIFAGSIDPFVSANTSEYTQAITLYGATDHVELGTTLYGFYSINNGAWQSIGATATVTDTIPM